MRHMHGAGVGSDGHAVPSHRLRQVPSHVARCQPGSQPHGRRSARPPPTLQRPLSPLPPGIHGAISHPHQSESHAAWGRKGRGGGGWGIRGEWEGEWEGEGEGEGGGGGGGGAWGLALRSRRGNPPHPSASGGGGLYGGCVASSSIRSRPKVPRPQSSLGLPRAPWGDRDRMQTRSQVRVHHKEDSENAGREARSVFSV